ncbi:MAG: histidinol dehydrogenase [Halanaerobiaceae bacterium]|jgi:histidinol dehydrogenase|nr:histidinol dehydrogenase [Halanaerobiaceae bacterium]
MKCLKYPLDKLEIEERQKKSRFDFQDERTRTVERIVDDVRENGDQAVFKYTEKYDGVKLKGLKVSREEIDRAYEMIDKDFLASLRKSIDNVAAYHRKQLRNSWFTFEKGMTGQLFIPLERVGAYVPGGTAPLPSSVVMTVVPARAAGVKEIVVVSPPDKNGSINPYTLVAASEAGADEIYKAGGAQAIAALAFGTETIRPVDKIVGPGNIYVTLAKKIVYGIVDIDMLAGPSEILVLADETANPEFIAADLLSQAEHDTLAVSTLITTDEVLAEKTITALNKQLDALPRKEFAREAIENNGTVILVDNLETGIELANDFAPEHFELIVKEPFRYLSLIKNAGAIFIGDYSSEPLGDYMAGPNHVLPTGGTARFASPLNTDDFIKKSSIIYYQRDELAEIKDDVIRFAELEGLDAHARAIKVRFE